MRWLPTGAAAKKLVFLSIVAVPTSGGRLTMVPAAPSVSAKATRAPPCRTAGAGAEIVAHPHSGDDALGFAANELDVRGGGKRQLLVVQALA
jgi:hypothetical protein